MAKTKKITPKDEFAGASLVLMLDNTLYQYFVSCGYKGLEAAAEKVRKLIYGKDGYKKNLVDIDADKLRKTAMEFHNDNLAVFNDFSIPEDTLRTLRWEALNVLEYARRFEEWKEANYD